MTAPTPAAQKAAQALLDRYMIAETHENDESDSGTEYTPASINQVAAIIDREMNQWQDIATAPLNGADLVLSDGCHRKIGYWLIARKCWMAIDDDTLGFEPTHFIPLNPEFPKCTAKT